MLYFFSSLLLANCSDKIIRLYRLDEQVFVPTGANGQCSSIENSEVTDHASGVMKSPKLGSASFCVKFADTVSKCGWNKALITPNALFIVATAALKDSHTIYIFDSNTAQIVQVLQDSRDSATDVTVRCIISISSSHFLSFIVESMQAGGCIRKFLWQFKRLGAQI